MVKYPMSQPVPAATDAPAVAVEPLNVADHGENYYSLPPRVGIGCVDDEYHYVVHDLGDAGYLVYLPTMIRAAALCDRTADIPAAVRRAYARYCNKEVITYPDTPAVKDEGIQAKLDDLLTLPKIGAWLATRKMGEPFAAGNVATCVACAYLADYFPGASIECIFSEAFIDDKEYRINDAAFVALLHALADACPRGGTITTRAALAVLFAVIAGEKT